jgi:hypothetical protein
MFPQTAASLQSCSDDAFDDYAFQPRDLVILARYLTPVDAFIVRNCLRASGVPAVVADDQLVQTNSLWTMALGGVRVLVPQEHLAEAQLLLSALERGELALREDADPF